MREPTCLESREWFFSDSAVRPFLTQLGTLFASATRCDYPGGLAAEIAPFDCYLIARTFKGLAD